MRGEPRSVVDRLADVVFYGPLGFALEHRRLLPHLARRGRRQIALTRMIGRFTVSQGRNRLTALVEGLAGAGAGDGPETASDPPSRANGVVPPDEITETPSSSSELLAITQYDSLSAIQVVPRLDGLSDEELTQIRDYETATRARRTILAKIRQLQQ